MTLQPPPEARRGMIASFVFGAIGVVAMILSLTVSDANKDLRGLIMVVATFTGPVIALFGNLIAAIACVRANKGGAITSSYVGGLALNVVLPALWLWRWSALQ